MAKQSFIGGLRTNGFNATTPFAGLTLTDDEMTLRLLDILRKRRRWSEVANVQQVVGGLLASPGIRVTLTDGDRFVFWSFNPSAVIEVFRSHGVRIVEDERPPRVWLGT